MSNANLPLITSEALTRWDEWLRDVTDIPASSPGSPLPLDSVGVTGVCVPLRLEGFAEPLLAYVDVTTSLPPGRRGIHMSRLVEEILAAEPITFSHPVEYATGLAERARQVQEVNQAEVVLTARGFVPSTTARTGRRSLETLQLRAAAKIKNGTVSAHHGVELQILTACPCTQTFFRYEAARMVAEAANLSTANRLLPHIPAQTHVQRGTLLCEVGDLFGSIGVSDLAGALRAVVTTTRELLKRPDEHALVEEAHRRAQFTEDVVRDVARSLLPLVHSLPSETSIAIRATAEESIHPHNAKAAFSCSAGDLIRWLT